MAKYFVLVFAEANLTSRLTLPPLGGKECELVEETQIEVRARLWFRDDDLSAFKEDLCAFYTALATPAVPEEELLRLWEGLNCRGIDTPELNGEDCRDYFVASDLSLGLRGLNLPFPGGELVGLDSLEFDGHPRECWVYNEEGELQ